MYFSQMPRAIGFSLHALASFPIALEFIAMYSRRVASSSVPLPNVVRLIRYCPTEQCKGASQGSDREAHCPTKACENSSHSVRVSPVKQVVELLRSWSSLYACRFHRLRGPARNLTSEGCTSVLERHVDCTSGIVYLVGIYVRSNWR